MLTSFGVFRTHSAVIKHQEFLWRPNHDFAFQHFNVSTFSYSPIHSDPILTGLAVYCIEMYSLTLRSFFVISPLKCRNFVEKELSGGVRKEEGKVWVRVQEHVVTREIQVSHTEMRSKTQWPKTDRTVAENKEWRGNIEGLIEKVIVTWGELQHRTSGLIEPGDLLESTRAAVAPACAPDKDTTVAPRGRKQYERFYSLEIGRKYLLHVTSYDNIIHK